MPPRVLVFVTRRHGTVPTSGRRSTVPTSGIPSIDRLIVTKRRVVSLCRIQASRNHVFVTRRGYDDGCSIPILGAIPVPRINDPVKTKGKLPSRELKARRECRESSPGS